MPLFTNDSRLGKAVALALLALPALLPGSLHAATAAAPASSTVVISQVYTAGGNSGATFNADYVELFNLSSAPVNLTGWSLQYFSATASATSTPVISKITGSPILQPGQRFLVEATPSTTNGAPTAAAADQVASNLAMGAVAGRIYVVNSSTALSNASGCPTAYVDFVGYGSTANCFEGSAPATAPSLSQPIARTNSCVDGNSNNTDFALTSTPARNSSSAATACAATLLSSAAFNPGSVNAGSNTLLTATGVSGLTVTADFSAFGGSTTTPLFDDGTNGDVTPNDGIYSLTVPVPSYTPPATYTVNITGRSAGGATASVSASGTVTTPVAFLAIHSIQGSTPGTSPYAGQVVMTHGIVTGIVSNGYYIQARDSEADADPHTPEGIVVYTGSGNLPSGLAVGQEVQVTGTATLYPSTAVLPGLELSKPTGFSILTSGNPLPAAITLSSTNPSPSGGIQQLAYLQGMRVAVPSLTVTQPTDGTLTETAETYTSNGQFWGEVSGLPRPTREPGLEARDPYTASQPSTIARFDDDPETFLLDSLAGTTAANALNLATGATLSNVSGVVDLTNYGGVPGIVIDSSNRPTVTGTGVSISAAPPAAAGQIAIGDQNMERFYNSTGNTNGALTVTPAAYALRLSKASLGIRNVLNTPDILALEEMEDLPTLTDLSNKISADAQTAGQPDPHYQPYLVQGNDSSGINVAFLVKPATVDVIDVTQFGKSTTYTTPTGGQAILNDRPPLVLHAGIKRSGGTDYPVTVIVNHLRSLNSITDPSTGATVRAKREAQAEYLANLVQGYQVNGEHVVVVGDFNAFDVNDGLVDSLGVIRGNPAPAAQDVVAGATGLVNPTLVDAAPTNVPSGAYSYVFDGYAQSIDHFLTTQDIAGSITAAPAHWNADFPVIYRNDATRPEVSTDHDGIVGYLTVPVAAPSLTYSAANSKQPDGSYLQVISITNNGSGTATAAQITGAAIGNAPTTTSTPVIFGDIAPGATVSRSLIFPASAGPSGSIPTETFTGSYSNTTVNLSAPILLP